MAAECPEVMKLDGDGSKIELLKVYMETIFYRDVVERFRVRDVSSLEYFSKALGECLGCAAKDCAGARRPSRFCREDALVMAQATA